MTLTWYGHSCFRLDTAEGSAVFDPYYPGSVPGLAMPELTADAVFCSHFHRDHGAEELVKRTGREPRFAVTRIDTFHDEEKGALRGDNLLTVIEAEGLRIAHLGDLGHELNEEQLRALGRVDVLMLPVGGHYTVDAPTAARICRAVGARTVIPMHYRGEGFGYGVIGTVDAFTELLEPVTYLPGNCLDLAAAPAGVVVFAR